MDFCIGSQTLYLTPECESWRWQLNVRMGVDSWMWELNIRVGCWVWQLAIVFDSRMWEQNIYIGICVTTGHAIVFIAAECESRNSVLASSQCIWQQNVRVGVVSWLWKLNICEDGWLWQLYLFLVQLWQLAAAAVFSPGKRVWSRPTGSRWHIFSPPRCRVRKWWPLGEPPP